MASFDKCFDAMKQASGREDMTDRDMAALMREVERRAKRIKAAPDYDPATNAAALAADELAADISLAQVIERRAAVRNARRRIEMENYLGTTWADHRGEGIVAILVGGKGTRAGSRYSVDAVQKSLAGSYTGGVSNDIRRLSKAHLSLFASGSLDREIAQALWAIDTPGAVFKGQKEAAEIAAVIRKWQEKARLDANAAGAWINKLPGYITRQGHDMGRIRRAGRERWTEDVKQRIDWARTLAGATEDDIDSFLHATFNNLATGKHLKYAPASEALTGFKGPANLAKRLSRERVLHFKSADDWFDYNQLYGTGSLRESTIHGLEKSARSTALMQILGTNPQAMVDHLVEHSEKALHDDIPAFDRFGKSKRTIKNSLAVVDGTVNVPENAFVARVAANVRALFSTSKLGGATISSVTDVAAKASELKWQGNGLLSPMLDGIESLLRGRGSDEQKEILSQLGVFFDNVRGELIRRFSADDSASGWVSRAQNAYFRLNGLAFWTDAQKAGVALMMSHNSALHAGKAWAELSPEMVRAMSLYGIDAGKWDILRSGKQSLADGHAYVTPEALHDLPDDSFAAYIKAHGIEPTPKRIAELRDEIASQYSTYITDRVDFAVPTPDGRTRALMLQGSQPGSLTGEMYRFIFQFKAFPIAFAQKAIRREAYGYGANTTDSLMKALMSGNGEIQGMVQLIWWMTVFGYGALVAKEFVKHPTHPERRKDYDPLAPATLMRAAVQGGGFGLYGDFLLGQAGTFSGGTLASAAGPAVSTGFQALDLLQQAKEGEDVDAKALRLAWSNIPGVNLFYTRAALDYMLLYRAQEWLSPGFQSRMDQRIQKENAQQFTIRPQR